MVYDLSSAPIAVNHSFLHCSQPSFYVADTFDTPAENLQDKDEMFLQTVHS
jgi:hypothetical protein